MNIEGRGGEFYSNGQIQSFDIKRDPSKLIGRFCVIFALHVCQKLAIRSGRYVKKILNFGALRIARKSSAV